MRQKTYLTTSRLSSLADHHSRNGLSIEHDFRSNVENALRKFYLMLHAGGLHLQYEATRSREHAIRSDAQRCISRFIIAIPFGHRCRRIARFLGRPTKSSKSCWRFHCTEISTISLFLFLDCCFTAPVRESRCLRRLKFRNVPVKRGICRSRCR